MVRELYPTAAKLGNDAPLESRIEAHAPKTFELTEILVKKLGVTDSTAC